MSPPKGRARRHDLPWAKVPSRGQRTPKGSSPKRSHLGDILARAAGRAGLSVESLLARLLAQNRPPGDSGEPSLTTRTDVQRLLLVCERLGLDPLSGEAYLSPVPGGAHAPVQVVVGLGGWLRLLNEHPAVCGIEFEEGPPGAGGQSLPAWISCTIHRSDRSVPATVREYMDESRGSTGAWLTHPRRMLRHCALVQCARVAIGPMGVTTDETGGSRGHNPPPARLRSGATHRPQGTQHLVAALRASAEPNAEEWMVRN